ncbi:MAG: prepilin-type N-terminal cleavage/methylation domain-containing protein [Candidatus Saccharimonadales bacterium]
MSDNTNHAQQSGYTLAELLISLFIIGLLAATLVSLYTIFFDNTLRNNYQARLAVESQGILRSIVEELRVSSGIRATSMPDSNVVGGGANWSTSNANLVLIIATPAVDDTNTILFNTNDGKPYLNELVYYAAGGKLFKRYLVDPLATNNRYQTSCPPNLASSTCPSDVLLSDHFKTMTFDFYDQDNVVINQSTGDITKARSIQLNIDMEHKTFGQIVTYNNKIRMTMRNNQL